MTNSVKGVVTREIDGKTYGFRLGTNEWCELEDALSKSTTAIVRDLEAMAKGKDVDQRLFRAIFRAALSFSDPEATAHDAGNLMEAMGLEQAGLLVVEVVQLGMPKQTAGAKRPAGKPKRVGRP